MRRWTGRIRIHTFRTMIVPSAAPACMYAARPPRTCVRPYASPAKSRIETAVAARAFFPSGEAQSAS